MYYDWVTTTNYAAIDWAPGAGPLPHRYLVVTPPRNRLGRRGKEEESRGTMRADASPRPERAGPASRGGMACRSSAAALARGVGHGITVDDGDRIGQRRRDGGGAAAEKG